MEERMEDLYETRTNLLSCDNLIDYFWRRCDHNSYPFKPESSVDIITKEADNERMYGKEIFQQFEISSSDWKKAGMKNNIQYNFDVCEFTTLNINKEPLTKGVVTLVYKPDRKWYAVFLLKETDETRTLKLIMTIKQKVSLFGSFENEMINFY